ncbi:beta-propeller fold lactonase family protein [Bacillus songklensis]|uniref:Beta-propeller fold lactonase family protein n=1 Tax=Bacillus songklensis TaxID=1069116 RepID=A0ABV8AW24_9BACI
MKWKRLLQLTILSAATIVVASCQHEQAVTIKQLVRDHAAHSDNMLLNDKGDTLYVANMDINTVSILDAKTKKVQAEVSVGKEPRQLALSPDDQYVYVSCLYDNQVDVISTKEKKVVDSIEVGIQPYGLVTSQNGDTLYVANYQSGTLSIIDTDERKEKKELKIGDRPRTVTITKDGKKLYVPHYLDGDISVIDTEKEKVTKTIKLAASPDQPDRKKSQGVPNTVEQFVISPDGKKAFVPHLLTNIDTPINFEETIFPAVSVIDLEKDEEIIDERKELFDEINIRDVKNENMIVSNPYDVAFQPDGSKAYVVMSGSEDLVVFDLTRGGNATQILRRIKGDNPRGIAISKDGQTLFVHNAMSHDLATIQTGGDSPYARVKMTGEPVKLIKKDPLPKDVREGKTIFYSANSDEFAASITGNNWMSCASCHADGDMNRLTLMTPKGPRNIPSNVVTTETGLFLWDGTRNEFADYIHTVQGEMGGMTELDPAKPMPEDVQHMYDLIFAFLQDPNSFPPPQSPYRQKDGRLTDTASQGEQLFNGKGNCLSCHGGEFFTDSPKAVNEEGKLTELNTNFLHDIGTGNKLDVPSKGDARGQYQNPRDGKKFDTPTLRGVWATAPYFHDGSAETIEEAIERHGNDSIPKLSKGEVTAIAEYVKSIE